MRAFTSVSVPAVVLLFVLAALSAVAQDSICDGYTGAAWGLCNAFCVALKCGSADQQATDSACDRIADRFFEQTWEFPPGYVPSAECPCQAFYEIDDLLVFYGLDDVACNCLVPDENIAMECYDSPYLASFAVSWVGTEYDGCRFRLFDYRTGTFIVDEFVGFTSADHVRACAALLTQSVSWCGAP